MSPLSRAGQPFSPAPTGRGLPKVAQTLIVSALEVAGQATVGTLRVINRITGNVIFDGYLQIKDGNGVTRVELGNLPVNGVSSAQFGLRVNDASGNPIFDSLGLISVMQQLGHVDNTTTYTNSTATPTVISGTAITFSLSRQVRVLAMASCFGSSASQTGTVTFFVDGVDQGGTFANMAWGGGAGGSTATIYLSNPLAAGSHTIDLRGRMLATPGTLSLQTFDHIVWQLGS